MHDCTVEGRGAPGNPDPPLARDRLVDDAEDRTSAAHQRDQCAEQRNPANKRLRPVNRVQDPDELGILPHTAEFLADDAVLRESCLDQRSHLFFGGPVGRRHRAQIGLVVDREGLAEIWANDLPRRVSERCRESSIGVELAQRR